MQYIDSVVKQIEFNNNFGNPIAGIPLTTCIKNEKQKNNNIAGGNIQTNDNFERLEGLVIPMGVYQTYNNNIKTDFKQTECKVIDDKLFDNLFNIVLKNKPKQNKTLKNKPANTNNKTKRTFSFF